MTSTSTIDRICERISDARVNLLTELQLRVGTILLEELPSRSDGDTLETLSHHLQERVGKRFSPSYLSRAMRVAEIIRQLPAPSSFSSLKCSLRNELAALDDLELIEELATEAARTDLGQRELRALVNRRRTHMQTVELIDDLDGPVERPEVTPPVATQSAPRADRTVRQKPRPTEDGAGILEALDRALREAERAANLCHKDGAVPDAVTVGIEVVVKNLRQHKKALEAHLRCGAATKAA